MLFTLARDLIKGFLCRSIAIPYLRVKSRNLSNVNDLVNLTYNFQMSPLPRMLRAHFPIKPAQIREEIVKLLRNSK